MLYVSIHNQLEVKYYVYMEDWRVLNYALVGHQYPSDDVAAIGQQNN